MSQARYLHIVQSEISQERSKIMNFHKRICQPILCYFHTEAIKRRGKISLHKHFNQALMQKCHGRSVLENYQTHTIEMIESIISMCHTRVKTHKSADKLLLICSKVVAVLVAQNLL